MLSAAHPDHLPALRPIIEEAARESTFDPELAQDGPEARLFFANLRQALISGSLVEPDPQTQGQGRSVPLRGYVYRADDASADEAPIGFCLFKGFAPFGHELWMTAIHPAHRGQGHGRRMLAAVLKTPAGRLAWTVRVNLAGSSSAAMHRLLLDLGFAPARESAAQAWYLRGDAPAELVERLRSARILERPAPDAAT